MDNILEFCRLKNMADIYLKNVLHNLILAKILIIQVTYKIMPPQTPHIYVHIIIFTKMYNYYNYIYAYMEPYKYQSHMKFMPFNPCLKSYRTQNLRLRLEYQIRPHEVEYFRVLSPCV